uniref:(northern house mosquito) hypothetical protein n=1 Tax=Culex pipiens TaxID=7175 RepID=A0A8D8IHB8_CULPI
MRVLYALCPGSAQRTGQRRRNQERRRKYLREAAQGHPRRVPHLRRPVRRCRHRATHPIDGPPPSLSPTPHVPGLQRRHRNLRPSPHRRDDRRQRRPGQTHLPALPVRRVPARGIHQE